MIETARSDDLGPVVALWQQAGLTRPWNDPAADFTRAVASPSSAILLRRGETGLRGTVMVGHDGHRGWVYYLAVATGHRGEGIGADLMGAAEAWLSSRGLPKIQFMVRRDNSEVIGFYDHLGYQLQDVVVLGRRLDELA